MARFVSAGAGDALRARQKATPLADALDQQRINRLAHFDVPAHKSGRGNPELTDYLGFAKENECFMTGPEDMNLDYINVLKD